MSGTDIETPEADLGTINEGGDRLESFYYLIMKSYYRNLISL